MGDRPGGVASVHFVDGGPAGTARRVYRRNPDPGRVPGLRQADLAIAVPFGGRAPISRRAGLVAFWDDDAAIDRFLDDHPLGEGFATGFHARLRPLRAYGGWPGLDPAVPATRKVDHGGPALVLTLGRLRVTQGLRFMRFGKRAEEAATGADGMVWGTGMARLPFVATCSLWESAEALSAYAYGRSAAAHPDAIAEDKARPFHHQSAFIRFEPYRLEGSLAGTNPLPADTVQAVPAG